MKKRIFITVLSLLIIMLMSQSVAFAQGTDQLDMELLTPEHEVTADEAPVISKTIEPEAIAQAVVPGKITELKAVSASSDSIKLTWKKATNTYKYLIYRSTTKSGGYKLIRKQRSVSYTDTGLKSSARYYYKVIPYTQNNTKDKAAGPVTAVTKAPEAPRGLDSSIVGGWSFFVEGEYGRITDPVFIARELTLKNDGTYITTYYIMQQLHDGSFYFIKEETTRGTFYTQEDCWITFTGGDLAGKYSYSLRSGFLSISDMTFKVWSGH